MMAVQSYVWLAKQGHFSYTIPFLGAECAFLIAASVAYGRSWPFQLLETNILIGETILLACFAVQTIGIGIILIERAWFIMVVSQRPILYRIASDDMIRVSLRKSVVCPICLDDMQSKRVVAMFPVCMHYFHYVCMVKWRLIQNSCPVCRLKVNPLQLTSV
jgi:hypothetical protein